MDCDATRDLVLKVLHGRLWHTTHPDRFKRILETGSILPIHPDNPNPDGWKTMSGAPYRTYAHTLGAVSLFDFDQFDPEAYHQRCPGSTWETYVPFREKWGSSVWIEIDREKVAPQLISGPELIRRNHAEGAQRYSIMPYIEAAHVGSLPTSAFVRAFIIGNNESEIRYLPLSH
jgi:hypothetical protein